MEVSGSMRGDPRSERRLEILKAVVRAFIADGEPVGSRTIAESAVSEVSPATIRNLMAELEEGGYLSHPHASAGRVPTEKGYRLYVDLLLDERRRRVSEGLGAGEDDARAERTGE